MRVLVTGATGFIGRHLVKRLQADKSYQVFCFVRNQQKAEKFLPKDTQLIYGDITIDEPFTKLESKQFDLAFHCAAYVKNDSKHKLYKANVQGTRNICQFCLKQKVKRLIYLSSVAVVSGNSQVPLAEGLGFSATNAYGQSKIEAEKVVLEFRSKGLPVVILRPPIVYGEDEPHALKLLLSLLKLRILPLINQGQNKLHMAYVENLVAAMLFCLKDQRFLKESFFVADSEVFRVFEIFKIFTEAIDGKPPFLMPKPLEKRLIHLPGLKNKLNFFLKDRVYSLERIQTLGFKAPYPAKESLALSAKGVYYGHQDQSISF